MKKVNQNVKKKNPIKENDLFVSPIDISDHNIPNGNSIFLINCKKVFLFIGASPYTLASSSPDQLEARTKQTAHKMGIKELDLVLVPHPYGDAYSFPAFLARFFDEYSLKKAKVFFPYHETRKFKFFFDRLLYLGKPLISFLCIENH